PPPGSPPPPHRFPSSPSPPPTANRRAGRAILPASAAPPVRRATRSRTSMAAATPIRRRRAKAPCKGQGSGAPKTASSPPTAAAAPHVAGVATIEVIKARGDAAAVPVPCNEPDAFPRGPAETSRRPCREPRAVDDEIAAVRGLHDFDHVLVGRQIVPVLIVPPTWIFHLVCEGRCAYRRGQGERRHPLEHFWPPPSVPIPKFASPCCTLSCDSSVGSGFEVPMQTRCQSVGTSNPPH